MKQITAFAISFKRARTTQKSEGWESGLFIGKDATDEDGIIVDMDGKVVPTVYNYYDRFHDGTLVVREVGE